MNDRFVKAMEYVISAGLAYNQADFAEKIGVGRSVVTGIKNGYKEATPYYMDLVANAFKCLNSSWLSNGSGEMLAGDDDVLTGEGDMLGDHDPRTEPTEFTLDKLEKAKSLAEELGVKLIPMYSEPFKGGNDGYPLAEDINEVESVWTMPDVRADMIVPVVGDSMAPTFPQGSRLAVSRVWFRSDEPLSIPFGEAFAIVLHDPDDPNPKAMTDYVKRLYKHDNPAKRREYWIARSDNDKYEDFEIPISHVVGLWRVRASIAYFA